MITQKKLVLALAICCTVWSCKPELAVIGAGDDEFLIERFDFNYLSSSAKLNYQRGNQDVSANAQFRIQKDSIIWASVTVTFGIEVARIKADRTRVQLLDRFNKEYRNLTYEELTQEYGVEVNYDLIEAIVVGNVLFLPASAESVRIEETSFAYDQMEGPFGLTHEIGKSTKRLERLHAYDSTSNGSIQVNYDQFMSVESQLAAQVITADVTSTEGPNKDIHIRIEYNSMIMEDQPLSFPFNVSSSYTRK